MKHFIYVRSLEVKLLPQMKKLKYPNFKQCKHPNVKLQAYICCETSRHTGTENATETPVSGYDQLALGAAKVA